jgi:integrase/recombinase XerD
MSPERLQFIKKLKLLNLSPKTIRNYEHALIRLAKHNKKSPLLMSSWEIEDYLLHELEVKKTAPSTLNMYIGAIRKFFALMAPQSGIMASIGRLKEDRKLPAVLSGDEIAEMVRRTTNLKHRAVIELLYSSGLRLGELVNLRPCDIDGNNRLVRVVRGKGGKQRYSIISEHALKTLRDYYLKYRPKEFLFEGFNDKQYCFRSVGKVIRNASQRAGISKNVTPHTLRHSFATHLLEQNVNLHTIQKLLGHASIKTTTIYTHVSNATITNIVNPLDLTLSKEQNGGRV